MMLSLTSRKITDLASLEMPLVKTVTSAGPGERPCTGRDRKRCVRPAVVQIDRQEGYLTVIDAPKLHDRVAKGCW
jgi:hypothetical protein